MNNEEIQSLMSELQKAGLEPEEIADGILWPLFRNGKMSKEDLGTLCSAIGLELDPDFEKDDHEEPAEAEAAEGISKEEAKAAMEVKEPEKADSEEKAEVEKEKEDDEDEEKEWEEVKTNLFKL